MFYLWERNDGIINATAGRMPQDYECNNGRKISFVMIEVYQEWNQQAVSRRVAEWKASAATVCVKS